MLETAPLSEGWQAMVQVIGSLERIHRAANTQL